MASSRSLTAKLDDARRLSFRELGWFMEAWMHLPFVRWRLARRGLKRSMSDLDVSRFIPQSHSDDDALRLARMVQAAANHHFISLPCLPRSVWIWSRLRRLGIPCELKLGVNRLGPHAWVEVNGLRLNESSDPALQAAAFERIASSPAEGDT